MIAQSCLHVRQAYTSWDLHIPTEFSYYLPMPHHVQSARAVPFARAEFEVFKTKVEEWTGKTITDDDLMRGIEIVNRLKWHVATVGIIQQHRGHNARCMVLRSCGHDGKLTNLLGTKSGSWPVSDGQIEWNTKQSNIRFVVNCFLGCFQKG